MKNLVGGAAVALSALIIWIAARYGYSMGGGDEADCYIWGAFYGTIAGGGVFLQAVATRSLRHQQITHAVLGYSIGLALLAISLSNSLGAMASRVNAKQADRAQTAQTVEDARRDLKAAQEERENLVKRNIQPADWAALEAAQKAAKEAEGARKEACTPPADSTARCIKRQNEEKAALGVVADLGARKAATDRMRDLAIEIPKLKDKIEKAGPVLEVNPQGAVLARLLSMSDPNKLSTFQNMAMIIVVEILIAYLFMTYEVLTHIEEQQGRARDIVTQPAAKPIPLSWIPETGNLAEIPSAKIPEEMQPDAPVKQLSAPRKALTAKKVAKKGSGKAKAKKVEVGLPIGDVFEWYKTRVVERPGNETQARRLYESYVLWCETTNRSPLTNTSFGTTMKARKEEGGLEVPFRVDSSKVTWYLDIDLKTMLRAVPMDAAQA